MIGLLGLSGSFVRAAALTGMILLAVAMSMLVSRLLSATALRGMESSFLLELPPYRRPQIGQVLVRSVMDRTLFVLGRAAAVAAPAGALLWMMVHIPAGDGNLLQACAAALDPVGRWIGLDGVILLAFILGFPANETVIPIMIMAYASLDTLTALPAGALTALLTAHGWTPVTALCVMLFTMFHWPCSTTCWTIRRESGALRWTALGIALPTAVGAALCAAVAAAARALA